MLSNVITKSRIIGFLAILVVALLILRSGMNPAIPTIGATTRVPLATGGPNPEHPLP